MRHFFSKLNSILLLLGLCILTTIAPLFAGESLSDEISEQIDEIRRPENYQKVTSYNAPYIIEDYRCFLNNGTVEVTGCFDKLPISDNEALYLFPLHIWETQTDLTEKTPLIFTKKNFAFSFQFGLDMLSEDSKLYDRFQVAVRINGKYIPIGEALYLENPEAVASCQAPFPEVDSIKGILVDSQKLGTRDFQQLHVQQAIYNVPLSLFWVEGAEIRPSDGSPDASPDAVGYEYSYQGRVYTFNTAAVAQFDYIFQTLSEQIPAVTAVLLNDWSGRTSSPLIHPSVRDAGLQRGAYYYALNATNQAGCEYLAALVSFLASRYSIGSPYGTVSNWIVGNEVNTLTWNYLNVPDLNCTVTEYAKAFRVCYNAIRSQNANARVYLSLDQEWLPTDAASGKYYFPERYYSPASSTSAKEKKNIQSASRVYAARDFLDLFAEKTNKGGNIDWGVAFHPYSVPMTWPKFWELPASKKDLVTQTEDSPYICMDNLYVLTDYLQKYSLRNPEGQVRHVVLSEIGYTSDYGEKLQAAAFAYTYFLAHDNPYVDGLLFSRETDAESEVRQGLALGLTNSTGHTKYIYSVFRDIDSEDTAQVQAICQDLQEECPALMTICP